MDDGDCDSPRNIIPRRPVTPNVNIEVIPPTPKRKLQRWSNLDALDSVFYNEADTNVKEKPKDNSSYGKGLKHFVLVLIWIICSVALMTNYEKVQDMHQIIVPKDTAKMYEIMKTPFTNKLRVVVDGALLPSYYGNLTTECLSVWVQLLVGKKKASRFDDVSKSDITVRNISDVWVIPVVTERLIGRVPEVEYTNIFDLTSHRTDNTTHSSLRLQFRTNLRANFPISVGYKLQPINPDDGIIYAAVVLTGLYLLIIFDLVHRTLAAMLASTISVAILAALDERPTVQEIVSWIDSETLLLLFSMMTLVTVFSETGVIDHAAVYAYKLTGGDMWRLINVLCLLTTVTSCFLDNVTTALLITPVTIKLCDVMNLNPRQILMYTLIAANIGGAITPMGDPPNVIIASNINVVDSGVNFGVFTLHMGVGSLVCLLVAYIQIRYTYRDMAYYKFEGSSTIRGLKREIAVWKKTAASVGSYSKEEGTVKDNLLLKTEKLSNRLKRTVSSNTSVISEERYSLTLKDLEKQYPIRNKGLLVKSGITLLLVISVFFLHSIPALSRLGLGWTAFLGVLLLLILYDTQELEAIFARVEWSTLLFFASLFILMEALSRLGLIGWIGDQTELVIKSVGPEAKLATAIILILWVSAIASAFVDNLPLTTMMIRIAVDLSKNSELQLPLQPLVWALSFGACLGGNGSLFGSSSNIVCAGIAEQHGYRFTFLQFMKVGGPVMITTLIIISVYLVICHVVLDWH